MEHRVKKSIRKTPPGESRQSIRRMLFEGAFLEVNLQNLHPRYRELEKRPQYVGMPRRQRRILARAYEAGKRNERKAA